MSKHTKYKAKYLIAHRGKDILFKTFSGKDAHLYEGDPDNVTCKFFDKKEDIETYISDNELITGQDALEEIEKELKEEKI